jgi:hypothetical protein
MLFHRRGCDKAAGAPGSSAGFGTILGMTVLERAAPGPASGVRGAAEVLRRVLVLSAFAFWVGGFFFYSGVVIHVGRDVLGHRAQGFVTQRVTDWLNVASLPALGLFAWDVAATRPGGYEQRGRPRRMWGAMAVAWLLMAAIQVALFVLHPRLDALLDPATRRVIGWARFEVLHAIYMTLSAVQHFVAAGYLVVALVVWRWRDARRADEDPSLNAATSARAA